MVTVQRFAEQQGHERMHLQPSSPCLERPVACCSMRAHYHGAQMILIYSLLAGKADGD